MTRVGRALVISILLASGAQSQDRFTPVDPIPLGDRLLTLPTTHVPDEGTWEVVFAHRFNQSLDEGEAIHSLFGLDSGANVGIGLSYVPRRDLQLAVIRSNVLDTIEASGKYLVLQQSGALPLSLTLRGGADIRTERDTGDRTSFFVQALLSRQFGQRLSIHAMPTLITDAGRAASGDSSAALFESACNVPVGMALKTSPRMSLVAEIIPPNDDLPDDLQADLGWAFGIKYVVGGHYFEVLLTNSSGLTTDQYVTSTFQGGPLSASDLRLGFNIERRFGRPR
jgi:hypothetical protein